MHGAVAAQLGLATSPQPAQKEQTITDTRLKDCLDRWPGDLPDVFEHEARVLEQQMLNSIARVCRLRYRADVGSDRWKTPDETWTDRCGDCEDIAILTGALVRRVFPGVKIELVLCWEARTRRGHAVLCVHGIEGLLYLDNKVRSLYGDGAFHSQYEEHSRLEWPA